MCCLLLFHKSSMLHPLTGSGVVRCLSRAHESAAPEMHLAGGHGHTVPQPLPGLVFHHTTWELQLSVCYPENTDSGAFLFVFVLQGVHFMLESCSAAPTHILGHICSCPAALCKMSAHRNVNSYFSRLTLERDEWSTPCQSPSAQIQLRLLHMGSRCPIPHQ